jgi:hypothetical protein
MSTLRVVDVRRTLRVVDVRRSYTRSREDVRKSGRVHTMPMIDQVARAL